MEVIYRKITRGFDGRALFLELLKSKYLFFESAYLHLLRYEYFFEDFHIIDILGYGLHLTSLLLKEVGFGGWSQQLLGHVGSSGLVQVLGHYYFD